MFDGVLSGERHSLPVLLLLILMTTNALNIFNRSNVKMQERNDGAF